MLTLQKINHSLMGEDIVHDFDLNVSKGEVVCLYGPSGCGKTTILRIIAGLIDHDAGRIINPFLRTRYLFQEHRLLPWRTLWENMLLTAPNPHHPDTHQKAEALLHHLSLSSSDFLKFPHELSGGMCQRAALARALLCEPDLLLLDEPFSALDYELKIRLYQDINERVRQGLSIVMVSHDRFEVLNMAHRIYVLDQKPAQCLHVVSVEGLPGNRTESMIQHYLQEPFWQPYHD